ncbi:hypothetical protein N7466_010083 [Penicillium verhagenii]|uniref:uncharacterized protein n=1 Tax=Penicillium verhagenii TaxID=1562060 RepID=UPI00254586F2|nr:uncharacterized protein N7466_010083 [Penicillium verhagenii]KAJ5919140.1 hypothetical protein N7466_010083 [Penicillium verhagenii]
MPPRTSDGESSSRTTMGTTTPEALTPNPTPQAETPITPDPQTIPQAVPVPANMSSKVATLRRLAPRIFGPIHELMSEYATMLEALHQLPVEGSDIDNRIKRLKNDVHSKAVEVFGIIKDIEDSDIDNRLNRLEDGIHSKRVEVLDLIKDIKDSDIEQVSLELASLLI